MVAEKTVRVLKALAVSNGSPSEMRQEDDKPADIYRVVAKKTVRVLKAMAVLSGSVSETTQEDDKPSDAELAQWWLDYGVTRKVTKRNCMTYERENTVPNCPEDKTGQEEAVSKNVLRTKLDKMKILLSLPQMTQLHGMTNPQPSSMRLSVTLRLLSTRMSQKGHWPK